MDTIADTAPVITRPQTSEKLLAVDRVSLEYRTRERIVRATHQVSFDVYGGDRFVLLGPSGCGKSTLLKAVAGFIQPTSGSISLDGQPVHGPGPDRIVVFQEFDQLPPWKTVLQNVVFPLRVARKLSRAEANEQGTALPRQGGACVVCKGVSPYLVGRHETTRRDRTGVGDAAACSADG